MPRFEQGPSQQRESSPEIQSIEEERSSVPETTVERADTHAETLVLVDGRILGIECQRLVLKDFARTDFPECYLETDSGNIYGLFRQGTRFVVADARSNFGKGKAAMAKVVSAEVMDATVLEVGRSFDYGSGNTSPVERITAVTQSYFLMREPTPEETHSIAEQQTGGRVSDVRSRYRSLIG